MKNCSKDKGVNTFQILKNKNTCYQKKNDEYEFKRQNRQTFDAFNNIYVTKTKLYLREQTTHCDNPYQ